MGRGIQFVAVYMFYIKKRKKALMICLIEWRGNWNNHRSKCPCLIMGKHELLVYCCCGRTSLFDDDKSTIYYSLGYLVFYPIRALKEYESHETIFLHQQSDLKRGNVNKHSLSARLGHDEWNQESQSEVELQRSHQPSVLEDDHWSELPCSVLITHLFLW